MKNVVGFPGAESIRKEAAGWIARLDGDEPLSIGEREALRGWIRRSSAHRSALHEAAELWGNLNILAELAPDPVEPECDEERTLEFTATRRSRRSMLAAAAGVAAIGVVGAILLRPDPLLKSNGYYTTAVGDQHTVELADGSVIEMNTDTQIKVEFGDDVRGVTLLRGEAYFDVTTDSDAPFKVSAGPGEVVAVGTAFAVYLKDEALDITVTEGRVSVSAASKGSVARQVRGVTTTVLDSVMLDAGQLATIRDPDPGQSAYVGKIVDLKDLSERELNQKMLWTEGILAFSRAPLHEVVAEIKRYSSLEIEFSDNSIAERPVIARIPIGDTETMLDIFENNLGLTVTYTTQNKILLSAKEENQKR